MGKDNHPRHGLLIAGLLLGLTVPGLAVSGPAAITGACTNWAHGPAPTRPTASGRGGVVTG